MEGDGQRCEHVHAELYCDRPRGEWSAEFRQRQRDAADLQAVRDGRIYRAGHATDGSTVRTGYDQTDRPNEAEQRDGEGDMKYRTLIEYDKKNRVKAFNEATANQNFKTEYTYDADNRVTKVRYNGSDTSKVDYAYDKLNRITSRRHYIQP